MPKFNPSLLPPVAVRRESKTFATKTGDTFTLTLEISDAGEQSFVILDKREELLERYQFGGPSSAGSAPVKVSATLCTLIARLIVMQAPGDGESEEDLWQFPQWAALAQRDAKCFSAINQWVNSLVDEGGDSPNPTLAPLHGSGDGAASSLRQP